jgi:hypothetical protein
MDDGADKRKTLTFVYYTLLYFDTLLMRLQIGTLHFDAVDFALKVIPEYLPAGRP